MLKISNTQFRDNLRLAWDLARRDLSAKYRRSIVGSFWLILTPLCLLGIYSLVFGRIFGVEWHIPLQHESASVGFVLPFFVGLAAYLTLSDVVNSSTVLFASKRTYVVKSPFPLLVLWIANLMRASVHVGVLLLLVLTLALIQQRLTIYGALWSMVSILICTVFISALSLLLASLGPFIGDISEGMRLLLRVLFYATPITYPLSMVPMPYREWMWFNPLTCMVELLRNPLVFSQMPPAIVFVGFGFFSMLLFINSWWVFNRVRGVISDVV